jgi:hypothetical protein
MCAHAHAHKFTYACTCTCARLPPASRLPHTLARMKRKAYTNHHCKDAAKSALFAGVGALVKSCGPKQWSKDPLKKRRAEAPGSPCFGKEPKRCCRRFRPPNASYRQQVGMHRQVYYDALARRGLSWSCSGHTNSESFSKSFSGHPKAPSSGPPPRYVKVQRCGPTGAPGEGPGGRSLALMSPQDPPKHVNPVCHG